MGTKGRPVDDLVWIEGHYRERHHSLPAWTCLYCYPVQDTHKAQAVVNRLTMALASNNRMPDHLMEDFDRFRIKNPGEESDADDLIDNIRNTLGGWALIRLMQQLATQCGSIQTGTGALCLKPKNHKGKHSSSWPLTLAH